MIENINPYNKTEFKKIFKSTEIYKKLEQDFGEINLIWENSFSTYMNNYKLTGSQTPRARFLEHFSATVFYYLMPLLEKNYNEI